MKIDLDDINIDDLDTNAIRVLKLSQLEKDKKKKDTVIATTAKRIDHLERAFRREELKHLDEDYEKQRDHDLKVYETTKEITLQEAQEQFKESISLKHRLSRLVGQYDTFKSGIAQRRHKEFEKLRQKADREFEEEKKKRIKSVMEQRAREQKAREEEARKAREEEERAAREAEEKAAAEEAKRQAAEERRKKAEADRAERDAAAQKQMQREAEAEARRLERKAGQSGRPAPFERTREAAPVEEQQPSTASARPVIPGLKQGTWREREAARKAAAGTEGAAEPVAAREEAAPASEAAPVSRSGYIPPHLRQAGAAPSRSPLPDRSASPANGASRGSYKSPAMRAEGRQDSREGDAPPAPVERKPASGGGKYVPPSMRNKA